MGRQCGWCVSPARAELERRVLGGESISSVALDTPHSLSAGHRHFRNHVLEPHREAVLRDGDTQLRVEDFAERMLGLADDAAGIRERALRINDRRSALLAIREERESLGQVMGRLGIDDAETVVALREARALGRAVSVVLSSEPATARALSRYLSDSGDRELATAFAKIADRAEANAAQVTQLSTRKGIAS